MHNLYMINEEYFKFRFGHSEILPYANICSHYYRKEVMFWICLSVPLFLNTQKDMNKSL